MRIPLPGAEAAYAVQDGPDEGFVRLSFEWPDGEPVRNERTVIDIDERVLPQIIGALMARPIARRPGSHPGLPALC